jgi:hypothetical protein
MTLQLNWWRRLTVFWHGRITLSRDDLIRLTNS